MADHERLSQIFAALASPTRLQIVAVLAEARRETHRSATGMGIMELAARLEISRFSASFHLTQLREAGLVQRNKSGSRSAHSLTDSGIDAIDEWIFDLAGDHSFTIVPAS